MSSSTSSLLGYIAHAATHETELGDHNFCLSRSHYTDTLYLSKFTEFLYEVNKQGFLFLMLIKCSDARKDKQTKSVHINNPICHSSFY